MDDETHDCGERKPSGRINIDEIYNGPAEFDANDPEAEHGRPVCNAAVFSFLTNIYHQRQGMRHAVPIPEHVTKTLSHVKNALLISPVSYSTRDDSMLGPDEFTESWGSKNRQSVSLGKEIVKMVPDRKGNRYKRKFYAGVGPDLAANAAPREGDILSLNNDMEQFEIAQFVNLFPESAEEAKALIPTLERFADKELHFYRDELTRFDRNSEGRSADRENPAKRIRVVSFANKTLESAMDEMKNISNIVPEEPRHHPTPISTQGTRQGTPATQGTPELGGMANQYDNHPFSADMNVGQMPNVQTPTFAPPPREFDEDMEVEQAPRSPGMQFEMQAPRSPGMHTPDAHMQDMSGAAPPLPPRSSLPPVVEEDDDDDDDMVAPRSPAPMAPRSPAPMAPRTKDEI